MTKHLAALFVVSAIATTASAQLTDERLQEVRRERLAKMEAERQQQPSKDILVALRRPIARVDMQEMPAQEAAQWISDTAGFNLQIDWSRLEQEGFDPQQPITIQAQNISAARLLSLFGQQLSVGEPMIWEANNWYVELMSKEMANERAVVKVYPIGDLLQEIPDFSDVAPRLNLQQQNSSNQELSLRSGGRGGGQGGQGGGQQGPFGGGGQGNQGRGQQGQQQQQQNREERAQELVDLIQETIEPDIWRENGGTVGSIRYYNDSLIIRAPLYVHQQIGGGYSIEEQRSAPTGAASVPYRVDRRYVTLNTRFGHSGPVEFRRLTGAVGVTGRSGAAGISPEAPNRDAGIRD